MSTGCCIHWSLIWELKPTIYQPEGIKIQGNVLPSTYWQSAAPGWFLILRRHHMYLSTISVSLVPPCSYCALPDRPQMLCRPRMTVVDVFWGRLSELAEKINTMTAFRLKDPDILVHFSCNCLVMCWNRLLREVQSLSLEVYKKSTVWNWGIWVNGHHGDGLMVGHDDLSGLLQTNDSMNLWFYLPGQRQYLYIVLKPSLQDMNWLQKPITLPALCSLQSNNKPTFLMLLFDEQPTIQSKNSQLFT